MFVNQVNSMLVPSVVGSCKDDYAGNVFALRFPKTILTNIANIADCFLSENTTAMLFVCRRARCCHMTIVEKHNCDFR